MDRNGFVETRAHEVLAGLALADGSRRSIGWIEWDLARRVLTKCEQGLLLGEMRAFARELLRACWAIRDNSVTNSCWPGGRRITVGTVLLIVIIMTIIPILVALIQIAHAHTYTSEQNMSLSI